MSDDTPETTAPVVLRREALLPNERSRGLGTVAVVCTMAGVASGLALATTLMAMQVADTMSARSCPYRVEVSAYDRGFLGTAPVDLDGAVRLTKVHPRTPAASIGLQPGDRIVTVNGVRMDTSTEFTNTIGSLSPGARPLIVFEREGTQFEARPTLIARPRAR